MKYKIEKNTVQETLILPLYSRKLCTCLLYTSQKYRPLRQTELLFAVEQLFLNKPGKRPDGIADVYKRQTYSSTGILNAVKLELAKAAVADRKSVV